MSHPRPETSKTAQRHRFLLLGMISAGLVFIFLGIESPASQGFGSGLIAAVLWIRHARKLPPFRGFTYGNLTTWGTWLSLAMFGIGLLLQNSATLLTAAGALVGIRLHDWFPFGQDLDSEEETR